MSYLCLELLLSCSVLYEALSISFENLLWLIEIDGERETVNRSSTSQRTQGNQISYLKFFHTPPPCQFTLSIFPAPERFMGVFSCENTQSFNRLTEFINLSISTFLFISYCLTWMLSSRIMPVFTNIMANVKH